MSSEQPSQKQPVKPEQKFEEFGGGNATIKEISVDSYPPDDFESLRASGSIPANLIDKIDDIIQKRVQEELSRSRKTTEFVTNEQA